MATEQQIQQMIDLMQQQMTTVNSLQAENTRLREAAPAVVGTNDNNNTINTDNQQSSYKSKNLDRPPISHGMDEREWAFFIDTWNRYKTSVGINDVAKIRSELREACSEEINKLLFEFFGSTTWILAPRHSFLATSSR